MSAKMVKKLTTRRELLERWRAIEEEEEDEEDNADSSKLNRLRQHKERWFSDAYNYLISLPTDCHIWCGYSEIMAPLLETFYNYFKVESCDSPLKVLWERISREMQGCTQCISQHHRAQEMYRMDYDSTVVSPLLGVLQSLDEERVAEHLKDINTRLAKGEYDTESDNAEVINVMFEVLSFPVLLDDQSLADEFQMFIEVVDNAHELTLAKQQNFPGVFALLFLKSRRVRSIGLRLAGNMGKLRSAADLEPLETLLKRYTSFLATEAVPSSFGISRPRVQLDRPTIWVGIKALLGFLEPSALEEGILEPYPVFLNIVLDHISDDSPEFCHAVNCMRQLFEILGCKLWLRTSLPPSVMRDSLLSQCFHTRNEKTHKDIFDLFYPLLQSLEALQDGELEKQRRHFLYFLLQQVTRSSNFSVLMRKKACQIALLIVHRGYKMNPPCPPTECAHIWGPSLVSSLKDASLHDALRQPAIDLMQTIIVCDAAALLSSVFHFQLSPSVSSSCSVDFEESEDAVPVSFGSEEKDFSCWQEYSIQGQIIYQEYSEWLCIPMLWFDVLADIHPLILPLSFAKAILWALSHLSMLELGNNAEMSRPLKSWLSSNATEVSVYLGWKIPTGSDDGREGKESKNSARVSTLCLPLIKTFKRLTAHYVIQMEKGELWRQWTWEPRMSESLILLLIDPNDNVRQVGRLILEHVSRTRGLACGLQFLCSSGSSMSALFLGIKHAVKLVQVDAITRNFQTLHHFFFILYKIFREGFIPSQCLPGNSSDQPNIKFATQGGFLRQPAIDSLPLDVNRHARNVEKQSWENFCSELAKAVWPSVKKCMLDGKAFINSRISQMTCVRLLEILPIVFEKLFPSTHGIVGSSGIVTDNISDFSWLLDLAYWRNSSLEVIIRYWKGSIIALLNLLKGSCSAKSLAIIHATEKIISCGAVSVDSLTEQVSQLSLLLSSRVPSSDNKLHLRSRALSLENLTLGKNSLSARGESFSPKSHVQILDSPMISKLNVNDRAMVSDDETEDHERTDRTLVLCPDKPASQVDLQQNTSDALISKEKRIGADDSPLDPIPQSAVTRNERSSTSVVKQNDKASGKGKINDETMSECLSLSKNSGKGADMDPCDKVFHMTSSGPRDAILKQLVYDGADNRGELSSKAARCSQITLTKQSTILPRRQVIQLQGPVEKRSNELEAGARKLAYSRKFRPPRLDDWFRPILEMDYFATVGLSSLSEVENKTHELKEVPSSFQSAEQYVKIFQPLVLEEFKAQLCSSFQDTSLKEMSCASISVMSVERIDEFHIVRCVHDDNTSTAGSSCLENDLVLLTKQPLQKSLQSVHLVGMVERREKDNKRRLNILAIRIYLQSGLPRVNRARKLLLARSKWHLSRVMSITPQIREFQALSSISNIPAIPFILVPASHVIASNDSRRVDLSKVSQSMQQVLKSNFNESQLQAISAVIRSPGSNNCDLSLVQGPPGTGKTRTIVAIISVLLVLSSSESKFTGRQSGSRLKSQPDTRVRLNQSVAIARAWQDAALARQLDNDTERENKLGKTSLRRRVLVCAQSNAAVDELVSRLAGEGLYGVDGNIYKPYIVRVGNAKTVHPNSMPYFIDTLVEHRLEEERRAGDGKNLSTGDSTSLRSILEKIVDRIRFYESKRASLKDQGLNMNSLLEDEKSVMVDGKAISDAEIGTKLRNLYEEKREIYTKLARSQIEERKANEETKAFRFKLRRTILKEAQIVVATLSGSGGDLLSVCFESASSCKMGNTSEQNLFDAVIVDEAAQALEPATLIPLQLLKSSGTKCIMVGDPKQLPATVLSNVASKFLYKCSMFERLQRAGCPVIMLTEQYRMHPDICRFPSMHFYDGKLLNGALLSSKVAPFHKTKGLGPYVFYDVTDGQQLHGKNSGATSLYNECEADIAVEVLKFFKIRYPSEFAAGRIGIITPYKCQLSLLRSRFSSEFGTSVASDMEFNTVDGFQGREVDILILSTVRAVDPSAATFEINSSSIGFVADVRRMNVALTRAKLSLWVLGNAKTLQANNDWAALIKDAKERNLVIPVKKPYSRMFEATCGKSTALQNSESVLGLERLDEKFGRGIPLVSPEVTNSQQAYETASTTTSTKTWVKKRTKHDILVERQEANNNKKRVDIGNKGQEHHAQKLGITHNKVGKVKKGGMDCSGQGLADLHKRTNSKLLAQSEPVKHGRIPQNKGISTHLDSSKPQNKDKIDGGQPSGEANKIDGGQPSGEANNPKNIAAKRKQQREAVEAILSSALISSKKSEASSKYMQYKRLRSLPSSGNFAEASKRTEGSKGELQRCKKNNFG